MWLLLHLLASLSLRSRFFHLSLFAWPRFTPPASHPWVSLVSIHCLSFAGQFACPTCPALRSLIYPKSYPPLFVFLPTFLSWLLIGHSSLPEFVSFDFPIVLLYFLWQFSVLKLLSWVHNLAWLHLFWQLLSLTCCKFFFFQLQIQFLALLTCFADHLLGAQLPVSHF